MLFRLRLPCQAGLPPACEGRRHDDAESGSTGVVCMVERRALLIAVAVVVALASVLAPGGAAASDDDRGIELDKEVDSKSIAPVLGLTLAVNKDAAIPGDVLTYSGALTNTGANLELGGRFTAESRGDATTTV